MLMYYTYVDLTLEVSRPFYVYVGKKSTIDRIRLFFCVCVEKIHDTLQLRV